MRPNPLNSHSGLFPFFLAFFFLQIDLEPRARPYPLTIESEQDRHGDESQGDEPQETVSPAKSKRVVHIETEKGEDTAEDGTQDGVGSDGRCSVDYIDR